MSSLEEKNKINFCANGFWVTKNNSVLAKGNEEYILKLEISDNELILHHFVNGKLISAQNFNGLRDYFGDILCFMDQNQKYFIQMADEVHMRFGEFKMASVVGQFLWIDLFVRVNSH